MLISSSYLGHEASLNTQPKIEIYGDRGKSLGIGLLGLLMTGCSAFALFIGIGFAIGIAGVLFFGLATLVAFAQAARPMRLTVSDAGVACSALRSWTMAWDEVRGVRLVASGSSSSVAVDYEPQARPPRPFGRRRDSRHIPNLLAESPERVCKIIAEALEAARGQTAPGTPVLPSLAPEIIEPPGWTVPWISVAQVIVLSLIFAAETHFPVSPAAGDGNLSDLTLVAFGASSRVLTIDDGQWFRVMTAPLLHANVAHLVGNIMALLWAGWSLERLVGRVWFTAVYVAGGLAGEVASLLVNPPSLIDVGASGAIMALFATAYVVSFHYRGSPWQSRLQGRAVGILGPAIFHFGRNDGSLQINIAAHVGGAAAGLAVGWFLLRHWPRDAPHPRSRVFATAIAGIGGAAVLAAVGPATHYYRDLADLTGAEAAFEAGDLGHASREVADFLAKRPDDGEAWSLKGHIELSEGDARGAAASFDRAYRLRRDPGDLSEHGLAAFYAGDAAAAMSDLRQAAATGASPYPAIWLDMIRLREGLEPSLTPGDLSGAGSGWPKPVAQMFAGLITPDALHSIAARARRTATVDELCEADVYIAEWDLAHTRRDAARTGFRRAVGECPPGFDETLIARQELALPDTAP